MRKIPETTILQIAELSKTMRIPDIAKTLGISERSVSRGIKWLKDNEHPVYVTKGPLTAKQ